MGIGARVKGWWKGRKSKKQGTVGSKQGMVGSVSASSVVHNTWIVRIEHVVLRVMAFLFSVYSAHAIAVVFTPSQGRDWIETGMGMMAAATFAVAGFFLSRNIAYRMFVRESWWGYVPLCLVVLFVEMFCNYVVGVSEVPQAAWLQAVPAGQRWVLEIVAYVVVSIVPLVTLLLAVMEMDIERKKHAQPGQGRPQPKGAPANSYPAGQMASYQGGYQGGPQQWQQGPGGVNGANPPVGPRSGKTP